jgi:hypothetical protein
MAGSPAFPGIGGALNPGKHRFIPPLVFTYEGIAFSGARPKLKEWRSNRNPAECYQPWTSWLFGRNALYRRKGAFVGRNWNGFRPQNEVVILHWALLEQCQNEGKFKPVQQRLSNRRGSTSGAGGNLDGDQDEDANGTGGSIRDPSLWGE